MRRIRGMCGLTKELTSYITHSYLNRDALTSTSKSVCSRGDLRHALLDHANNYQHVTSIPTSISAHPTSYLKGPYVSHPKSCGELIAPKAIHQTL